MANSPVFRCYLIGGDTLLSQCGEILIQRGHQIAGVITDAPAIDSWAQRHGLSVISTASDYASTLAAADYDFLFAITHLAMIPDAAVESPKRMAINFHDGPLPAYAGLNAPMWALMNGEAEFGITWHAMTAGIDEGDILARQPVTVSDSDTALSLNTKCFAAALDSFPVLVEQLERDAVRPEPQDHSRRSYFGRADKPPAAGLIDWTKPAMDIQRMIRALNTGGYENLLGSAKLLFDDGCYVVERAASVVPTEGVEPGQVADADASSLVVGAADGALAIQALRHLDGREVAVEDVIRVHGLLPGSRLPVVDAESADRIQAECAKHEAFWRRRLGCADATTLPYRSQAARSRGDDERQSFELTVPEAIRDMVPDGYAGAGAFLVFLARLLGPEPVTVALSGDAMDQHTGGDGTWLARHGFVGFAVDGGQTVRVALQEAAQLVEHTLGHGPWLRDLIDRDPSLRGNPLLQLDAILPVALVVGRTVSEDVERAELVVHCASDTTLRIECSARAYPGVAASHLGQHLQNLLASLATAPDAPISEISLASDDERTLLLDTWNRTDTDYDVEQTLHGAFRAQAARTPDAIAIADAAGEVTFAELDRRSDALAATLRSQGVDRGTLVGVHMPRSVDLLTATLGVMKAGAAYVPLDPAFPADRIAFMISDSAMPVIISHSSIVAELPASDATTMRIDTMAAGTAVRETLHDVATPRDLAYVIYTSGSTGKPKGVMIEHRNVVNFFAGMDERVPGNDSNPGVWLAVTSLSFDISVLELFWTLARGFKVVLYDEARTRGRSPQDAPVRMAKRLDLGLFMWGNDDAPGPAKYRLLIDGAKYFDANGYAAVWTPERHFHAFGGPYPNPAVTGAAVAAVTERVKIRAGSCVVPLHHPVRIAEEWAVVDNLSNGRVEIAAASGWNPNDFVLCPANHAENKRVMYDQLEQVRALWRGEKVAFPGPLGHDVEVESLPRPVQAELPCWITTAGNPETWRQAGELGLNVLTHLLGQSVEEVADKIRVYRQARADAGHDPAAGRVALMLHTFVGDDNDDVRELVREPMKSYLGSSMRLAMDYAWSFPAFKRPGGDDSRPEDVDLKSLSEEETDTILDFAFERYFATSGLFGDVDTCVAMLARCSEAGVDEIACLLDFGVDTEEVLASLPRLTQARDRADALTAAPAEQEQAYSFASEVRRHAVTHMQCTPSTARMFLADEESKSALREIPHLLLGGEALPKSLAVEICDGLTGSLTNMYGPTETTIWSLTQRIDDPASGISIGRPIANTQVYVLDRFRQPVPVGIPGELYLAGDGVARGYLNREELTGERFLPDPFRGAGARMYATGDLVCYRDDGTLDFIGRTDFQVKVRGYRIELGEIEHQLEQNERIAEAAVIVRADTDADQRLVAYVVGDGEVPDPAQLRAGLKTVLPDYMVPNEFVVIADMPRTANGKLDRKALLDIKPQKARQAPEDAAPANDTERLVANLWKQTLKLEQVGRNENFFDLGGHSLLVVQLHGQLKQALDRPVSLTDLYQYPTIRSLASFLNEGADNRGVKKAQSRGERRRAMRQRRAS